MITIEYDGELMKKGKMDYEKILKIRFEDYGGFVKINNILYTQFGDDPFQFYFACLCERFNGYTAKYEVIAEQTGYSVSLVKDKIKKMIAANMIRCKKSEKVKDGNGKYNTIPNTYYIVEQSIDEVQFEESLANLPEKYSYNNKEYRVTELRSDIINKSNIYGQHYFYVHEYKDDDPLVYKIFCESMETLKKKKFDFSKMEASWDNYLRQKNEKRKVEDQNKPVNGVRLKGEDEYVILSVDNIDKINFEQVEDVYYYIGTTRNDTKFVKIADVGLESKNELGKEKYEYLVDRYKQLVRSGKLATSDELMEIRKAI
jgi:hypothetical protein